jgi:hypothetical protein
MKTIKLECTDSDNITVSTVVTVDFEHERSVDAAFVEIIKYLQRIGLELPPDLSSLVASHTTTRKQFLKG